MLAFRIAMAVVIVICLLPVASLMVSLAGQVSAIASSAREACTPVSSPVSTWAGRS